MTQKSEFVPTSVLCGTGINSAGQLASVYETVREEHSEVPIALVELA